MPKKSPSFPIPALLACLAAVFVLVSGCEQPVDVSGDLAVEVRFDATQFNQSAAPWVFPFFFPLAADIAAGTEYASVGNYLSATLVKVLVRTNKLFYVTGAEVGQVRYRTALSNVHVDYLHPTYGKISPVYANLPTQELGGTDYYEAIAVNPDADNVFEVNLSSVLALFDHMDYDCDGLKFPADDDEIIRLEAGLFFSGYFPDGTEFGEGFPTPLHLTMTVAHGIPGP